MSATALATLLAELEDELFYAVLDVAMDIDQALTVQPADTPIYIDSIRSAIRFPILYPVHAANSAYRYAKLRHQGLMLLQKQSAIGGMEFNKSGVAGWEGHWTINVTDRVRFNALFVGLKSEEDRRRPGQKLATDIHSATARLLQLAESFHRVVLQLRHRRTGRDPVLINDEYDVQYVFGALLASRFADVRPEDWTPTHAGAAAKVDFFLKNESMLVEMKMTRDGLTDRKLGEELIVDIARYKQRADCKALLCFVYDPEQRLKNPSALEGDLTKQHDGLPVWVIIRPK